MIAFLGIGGNEVTTLKAIKRVLVELNKLTSIRVLRASSIYRNKAWGNTEQSDFLNFVLEIDCQLSAGELLLECLNLEHLLGRDRSTSLKWGPRIIDIDILLYGNETIEEEDLVIPHSFLLERDFFYIPLLELNSELTIPKQGKLSKLVSSTHNMIISDERIEV